MKASSPPPLPRQKQFPCKSCGAYLQYSPGTTTLTCSHCGAANDIPAIATLIEELDYREHLALLQSADLAMEVRTVRCEACGAETSFDPNVTAGRCPFCTAPIIAAQAHSLRVIRPRSLLPFRITRNQARDRFSQWLGSRWFAPGDLTKRHDQHALNGIYLPAWTYDSDTESDYTGQRGVDYWVTESYWTTVNGQRVRRTRQVKRTRWYFVSGRVRNVFDDVLIMASVSLPRRLLEKLEPWDLRNLQPYQAHYLAGFTAQSYQVDLKTGFQQATQVMDEHIRHTIRRDIGGDHQRIHSVNTSYYDIRFKHILLPVWMSAYRYHQKTYHFLVNARTGEVQGDRPYSWIKITLFILMILAIVAAIALFLSGSGLFQ